MIAYDKALHALVGGGIFSAAYILFGFAGLPALPIAAGAVVVAAVGKEIYDRLHRDRHTPDVMDAIWTVAGGVIPAAPIIMERLGR